MANLNEMSQIRHNGSDIILAKLNGSILYEKETEEDLGYCIEYTVDNSSTYALNGGTTSCKYGLPRIYSTSSSYTYNGYNAIEITLLDGSTTTDTSTTCNNVAKVRIWYPETTVAVKFYGASNYIPVVKTVKYCKTDNFTDMDNMFYYCKALTSLDASNWNTNNVTSMSCMFQNCAKLTSLDLSNWDTSKVVYMCYMFYYCSSLMELDIRNFNMGNLTYYINGSSYQYECKYMFSNCTCLIELRLDNCASYTIQRIAYDTNPSNSLYCYNTYLPTSDIGVSRNVYFKQSNWSSSTFRTGWIINYV